MNSWRGALEIVRFNWPAYGSALIVISLCLVGLGLSWWMWPITLILMATLYVTLASFLVSHWIYDCSPVADWAWLPDWLSFPIGRWLLLQTGFDSTHGQLVKHLPASGYPVVDLYGLPGIGGPSVERARKEHLKNPIATVSILPADPASCDTIFAMFCLHEIQTPEDRAAFFQALADRLRAGSRLIVVEHLRDWKNFLAFGPGFLHFQPAQEWHRCAARAALQLEKTRALTPFVRLFVWRKP